MYELPEGENKGYTFADAWAEVTSKETQRKIDEIVEDFLNILNERGN